MKLITRVRKSIYIQTPYFIPDLAILNALRAAVLSGRIVRIMILNKFDYLFVHVARLSFVHELVQAGAFVHQYTNGFLHAKTLIIDGKAFSVGSTTMDVRSFSLNFEANAFVYIEEAAAEMVRIFFSDAELSDELTTEFFEERSLYERLKQRIARLIAPIL